MKPLLALPLLLLVAWILPGCSPAGDAPVPDPPGSATLPAGSSASRPIAPGAADPPGQTDPRPTAAVDSSAATDRNGPAAAPADAAAAPDELIEVTFDDLKCNMQPDVVFRPWMLTDRARELDGCRIKVAGYMLPDLKQRGIKEFVLLRNTQCKFGPGGQADHLIRVVLGGAVTTAYPGQQPVEVIGVLKINPFEGPDGNTWSLYDMAGESVRVLRR